MYYLKTEQSFDSAHFLKGYQGKCSNLHGHRWRVLAEIQGEQLQEEGRERDMLVDFGDLKRDLKKLCDDLDHALIYETGSLRANTIEALQEEEFKLIEVHFRPTAESFALYFYEKMTALGYDVRRITVYETPDNCAMYEPS